MWNLLHWCKKATIPFWEWILYCYSWMLGCRKHSFLKQNEKRDLRISNVRLCFVVQLSCVIGLLRAKNYTKWDNIHVLSRLLDIYCLKFFHTLSHFLTAFLHTTISLLYLLYVIYFASVHFHYQSVQVIYITVTLAS